MQTTGANIQETKATAKKFRWRTEYFFVTDQQLVGEYIYIYISPVKGGWQGVCQVPSLTERWDTLGWLPVFRSETERPLKPT